MYNNIQFIHIPADKIWKPDILLCKLIILKFILLISILNKN
jgi:hypothetical protein